MKNLSLHITEKGEDKSDIPGKINNLAQVLHHSTKPNQHILVYTDGSTETRKRKSKNSGYGICITTSTHTPIFLDGGAVARMAIILLQKWQLNCGNQSTSPRPNHDHVEGLNGHHSSITTRPCF